MKFTCLALFFCSVTACPALAQKLAIDTVFIKSYAQKIIIQGYFSTNNIELVTAGKTYLPNYPLNVGLGLAVKNTVINATFDYGLLPLKSNTYGKTKLTDFQIHNYGRHFMLDLFLQKYKGFYNSDINNHQIVNYPNLSVSQIGAEGSYIFNGNKFSGKAAYEQSEKQLQSAGSFILGGGVYLFKIGLDSLMVIHASTPIRTFQIGVNLGYGYSWVINNYWMLSGIAKIGANTENEPQMAGTGKFRIYPTAFAKGSATYQKPNWSVSFLMLINNKSVYAYQNEFKVTVVNFQLAYVRHLNSIFKRKKRV
ncbi:DUF4421 family protein [Mucilaginibacter polytrichastri]|uniref:DUF4421 domain-containing protein n=1 Tax=Mucilaginibacter polytrichastri TaxID=1302689 RepID=A0A1Q6A0G2_9SPHI|nr:DUF4421 family protein [Mucilaginibacter polytrichastri]OKS87493.1 hypothetical protein RG47T_2954 [Mucilaginibacter polytrichastri]SFS91337.1 protein of unknown function [Mucilaginibacter polytrichastri]